MQVPLFKFRFTSTQQSSGSLGVCERCHTWASEIWHLVRYHYVEFSDGSRRHQGWAYDQGIFGHEACLQLLRQPVPPQKTATPAPTLSAPQTLTCCCCGLSTLGRQWWNRDTGYGLCNACAQELPTLGTTPKQMLQLYGKAGIHYLIPHTRHPSPDDLTLS